MDLAIDILRACAAMLPFVARLIEVTPATAEHLEKLDIALQEIAQHHQALKDAAAKAAEQTKP